MGETIVSDAIDALNADRFSAIGDVPVIFVDTEQWERPAAHIQSICVGVDRAGSLPAISESHFDLLITAAADAPAPWVSVPPRQFDIHLQDLKLAIHTWPVAASALCTLLRVTERLSFADALRMESFAYSTMLSGHEFARWRAEQRVVSAPKCKDPLVLIDRIDDLVTLVLNDTQGGNRVTAAMRDALYAALANVLDDPSKPSLVLQSAARCFSIGGDLGEFGTAKDLAEAHVVRTVRSCSLLLDILGSRACVKIHGACIGSGLEISAAAGRRISAANSWFQLPELHMGLIPGAGGTASIPRAIGRHRTAWMLVSARRINAAKALAWGLLHEIGS